MAFNIGLSGLKAASMDLEVTGNNIANASTVGFKKSRAEFGDLYSGGFLTSSSHNVGDGVEVLKVKQQFNQGNVSFTDNGLDMAINGQGFFVLNNNGETRYSRAGQFSIDKEGFVVNNEGMHVQGFQADDEGVLSGVRNDLTIDSRNLAPQPTESVVADLNLDSRQPVLVERGSTLASGWSGYLTADPSADRMFAGRSINPDVFTPDRFPPQRWTLTYADGHVSSVDAPPVDPANPAQALNYSAGQIANVLSSQDGVSASATTSAVIPLDPAFFDLNAGDVIRINGVPFTVADTNANGNYVDDLVASINGSSLVGFNASVKAYPPGSAGGAAARALYVTSGQGDNIDISFAPMAPTAPSDEPPTGRLAVQGLLEARNAPLTAETFEAYTLDHSSARRLITGELNFTFDDAVLSSMEGASYNSALGTFGDPGSTQILGDAARVAFERNAFDPGIQKTYNHATSSTIYDSLGNSHVMSQYFVKDATLSDGSSQSNRWTMYVQVDGRDVGPSTSPDPAVNEPGRTPYNLVFNDDGSLNQALSDRVVIPNWVPRDAGGLPNGATAPQNLEVDLQSATQYGAAFSVTDLRQDGYTTGRVTGLNVSGDGSIFANYSNGQSQVIAQVALANFRSPEGLAPLGSTSWAETFESGSPVYGAPGTGALGNLKASSVEESNVDLSQQLVNLIIAQRNFQANAKTIETSDAITQTIINLR